ncbi:proton-associated sugar transporter A-like isoform X2 [Armigeres subalbatus]|uniref:proton-associated sugar transporter A-like isoform X2 n=1 Tax=Armigeres subalbatus TaxID=124917 RepID=UPI002ED0CE0D
MDGQVANSGSVQITDAEIMKDMLQKRYDHGKNQPKDYSHLFRYKSRWELVRMTMIIVSIQFTYAAETAFVSPILLGIGIPHKYMTMIWAISPALGFFLAPLVASVSDQLRSSWGRRRPMILTMTISLMLGLIILPYGSTIGHWLGDEDIPPRDMSGFRWGILITIIGLIMADFSVETTNGLSRTYFLDMCIKEDHPTVLTVAVMIGGIGGFIGYLLGAIDWSKTNVGTMLGSNEATVFAAVVIIVLIGTTITLTSYREVPLGILEQDEMLRPISKAAFEEEKKRQINLTRVSSVISIERATAEEAQIHHEDRNEQPLNLELFLTNLIKLPKALKILYLTQFLSHLGYLSYCLYFTDFVGREIFDGDATAAEGSLELSQYDEGVRYGCLGMAIFVLSSAIYSLAIEKMIQLFSARSVYIGGLLLNSIGMMLVAAIKSKLTVFACCITMGVEYATIYSLPFLLISLYHQKKSFDMIDGQYIRSEQNRGFGADISILSSMLFLAQVIISLAIGSVIDAFGSTTIVVYSASLFSCLAAFSATQIIYMDL